MGAVTDLLQIFSNLVCYNTQVMPNIQVMNFPYIILLTPDFFNWLQVFWKICGTNPKSVHVIYPFGRTCENNMQSFMVSGLIAVLRIFETFNCS